MPNLTDTMEMNLVASPWNLGMLIPTAFCLWFRLSLIFLLGVVLIGCRDDEGVDPTDFGQPATCSIVDQNRFVLSVMQNIYFWNEQLPTVDPAMFETPETLLEALQFRPLDRFSRIVPEAQFNNAQQGRGISFGFGGTLDGDVLFITQVLRNSAAAEAGLQRGQRILSINGRAVADIVAGDGAQAIVTLLSPTQTGVQLALQLADLLGDTFDTIMHSEMLVIDLVPIATVLEVARRPTGYLFFRGFAAPAIAELSSSFTMFRERGVVDLVLDLRYNGGGDADIREFVGNLIGGIQAEGQVSSQAVYNANNQGLNHSNRLMPLTSSADISRLVVITTAETASASEQLINALRPHIDVTTVGTTTFGKPMASLTFPFCGKVLVPATSQILNANGEGDYFDGIPPDCPAIDDLESALGDPNEASLASALFVLQHRRCPDSDTAHVSDATPIVIGQQHETFGRDRATATVP